MRTTRDPRVSFLRARTGALTWFCVVVAGSVAVPCRAADAQTNTSAPQANGWLQQVEARVEQRNAMHKKSADKSRQQIDARTQTTRSALDQAERTYHELRYDAVKDSRRIAELQADLKEIRALDKLSPKDEARLRHIGDRLKKAYEDIEKRKDIAQARAEVDRLRAALAGEVAEVIPVNDECRKCFVPGENQKPK